MGQPWDFLDDENWSGGYYELAIKLGPRSSPTAAEHLVTALRTIWSRPGLKGCYRDRWTEPVDQERVAAQPVDHDHPEPLYGIADLPRGLRVVCASHVVREAADDGDDWIAMCLPLGALGRADPRVGAYPFGDESSSRAWREPIDDWFVAMAEAVAAQHQFELALIGHEVSGMDWQFNGGPAEGEWATYLVPSPTGLQVLPPKPWTDDSNAALDAMAADAENLGLYE